MEAHWKLVIHGCWALKYDFKCESLDYLNFTVTLVRADDLDSRVEMALDL